MINVQHLTKIYGRQTAVSDVSFSVSEGETVGLLGLNGAGKSTTMNILAGCLAQTDGSVHIGGVDMAKDPIAAKKLVGYLPELPPLYPDMTVDGYISFVHGIKKVPKTAAGLAGLYEQTGLSHVRKRLIKNLSKGYKQRVGLAAALVGGPKALILDEPTVGLDPNQILEMRALIAGLKQNTTVMLSSHILSEVSAVCERVIILHRGRLLADAAVNRLALPGERVTAAVEGGREAVLSVLQRCPGVASVSALREAEPGVFEYAISAMPGEDLRRSVFFALADARMPVLSLRPTAESLEDAFLRLISGENREVGA